MNWFELSDAERRKSPVGVELDQIDVRISELYRSRERSLRTLGTLPARDLSGIAVKLAVAERLLAEEDSGVAPLVRAALTDLVTAHPSAAMFLTPGSPPVWRAW